LSCIAGVGFDEELLTDTTEKEKERWRSELKRQVARTPRSGRDRDAAR
jgi:hypothetical protein